MNNQSCFAGKNLLILGSMDHYYLTFLVTHLKKYFKATHEFNFISYAREYGVSATERRIRDMIRDDGISVVIIFSVATDFELSPLFFQSLKPLTKVVFWFFDDDSFFEVAMKYFGQAGHAVITTDYLPTFAYARYEITAIHSPAMHTKEMYHPVDIAKDIDVSFVGDCTKSNRQDYIDFLCANGVNVESYGYGSKNGSVSWQELPAVYSRSKIVLSFNQIDWPHWMNADEPMLNRVRQNKSHFAQVAMTRSFFLSEFAPGLYSTAETGKELDVFHDKRELLEKVRFYLKNENKRNEIAENGYRKAVNCYEISVEMPRMLGELASALEKAGEFLNPRHDHIYLSRAFKVKSVNGLTFSMYILLGLGRIRNAAELFLRLFSYGPAAFLSGFIRGTARSLTVVFHKLTGKYSKIYRKWNY